MAGWFGDKINNRQEFFEQLAEARTLSKRLVQRLPYENPLKYVEKQLEDIERWTANGRSPTADERKKVFLALVFVKEYEMTEDDEILALRTIGSGIDPYVTF